jgi:hypothetical protein
MLNKLLRVGEVIEIRNYRRDLSLQLPDLLRMGEVDEITEIIAETSIYSCWSSVQITRRASPRSRKPRSKSCNRSQKGTEKSVYHIPPCPDLIFIGINNNTS